MFLMLMIGVAVVGYGLILYNGLVQVKHSVDQAFANIDVLLKQRHDELPKLTTSTRCAGTWCTSATCSNASRKLRAQAAAAPSADGERLQAEAQLSEPASAGCSLWPRTIPISRPTRTSCSCRAVWSALEEQIAQPARVLQRGGDDINNVRMEQMPGALLAP